MVMTYSQANVQGQWSVGSKDRVETNKRTEEIALPGRSNAVGNESIACLDYLSKLGPLIPTLTSDLRSFEIRFDFESNFRFGIRFVVMIRFEMFESFAPSIVLCKETIGGG